MVYYIHKTIRFYPGCYLSYPIVSHGHYWLLCVPKRNEPNEMVEVVEVVSF